MHNEYQLINHHCAVFMAIFWRGILFMKIILWIFYAYRIKTFFKSTPFYLSDVAFYVFCAIFIMSGAVIFIFFPSQFAIYTTSDDDDDDDEYRLCWVPQEITAENLAILAIIKVLNDVILNIGLLYLLYHKTKQLEAYQLNNQRLSRHYSQRHNNMINTKIMKRCIFCGITVFVLEILAVSLYVSHRTSYGLLIFSTLICMPIISSFDIACCNINNNNNQNASGLSMADQQYLQSVMAEFYRKPIRNIETVPMVQIEGH